MNASALSLALALLLLAGSPAQAEWIQFSILRGGADTPIPARCRLVDAEGKNYYPRDFETRLIGPSPYFFADGDFEVFLPIGGQFTLETDLGPHWVSTSSPFIVTATTTRVVNHVVPYVNLRGKNWYSADLDLDVRPDRRERIMAASDLNLSAYISGRTDELDLTDVTGVEHYPGDLASSRLNYTFGDFNVLHPLVGVPLDETTLTGTALPQIEAASKAAGWVDVANVLGDDVPVAAALDLLDSVRLVGPLRSVTEEWNEASVLERFEKYYALLGCGFKLAASAASLATEQSADLRDRAGFARMFVRIPSDFSYGHFFRRVAECRSWATNGPILSFGVNGRDLGAIVGLRPGQPLRVSVGARSPRPLDRVEVVYNGVVAATVPISATGDFALADLELPADRGGWIAVRAFEKRESTDAPFRYAHSSPIFIRIEGRGSINPALPQQFANELTQKIRELPTRTDLPPESREYLADRYGKARDKYLDLIR